MGGMKIWHTKKGGVSVLIMLVMVQITFMVFEFIPLNAGYFQYDQNKIDCEIISGTITESKWIRITRHTRYIAYTIVYTDNGELYSKQYRNLLSKNVGDTVELAKLPDGTVVPTFIQMTGKGDFIVFIELAFLIAIFVGLHIKGSNTQPSTSQPDDYNRRELRKKGSSFEPVFRSDNWMEPEEADFRNAAKGDDKLLAMLNTHAASTVAGVNTNEEVEVSEEQEEVLAFHPRKQKEEPQISFSDSEDLGEYEGINLDDLVVERLDD